jgi:ABC-type polysaccharide/polyol phosphate export permease
LNPVSGVISTARASFLGSGPIDWRVLGVTLLMSSVYFLAGVAYFSRTEQYFADIV